MRILMNIYNRKELQNINKTSRIFKAWNLIAHIWVSESINKEEVGLWEHTEVQSYTLIILMITIIRKKTKKNTHIVYKILMIVLGIAFSISSSLTIGFPIITIWLLADSILWIVEAVHGSTKVTKILWKIQGWIYLISLAFITIGFGLKAVGERLVREGEADLARIESEYELETEPYIEETVPETQAVSETRATFITDRALRKYQNEQSEEEFKQSCSDLDYKEFMRYPEKHIGDKVKLECKVVQNVMDTNGNIAFYHGQTRDDNGYWLGNEFVIFDNRSDDTRILEDDIITVYGKFTGMETVQRIIGQGYNTELPAIKMIYVDIASEEEQRQSDIEARALQYASSSALSKNRIIQQMQKEGYSEKELAKALNNIDIDWNEQAVRAANWYLGIYKNGLNRETLKEYLTRNEGFTGTEAEYALSQVGF